MRQHLGMIGTTEIEIPREGPESGLDSLEAIDFRVIVADLGRFAHEWQERAQSRAGHTLLAIRLGGRGSTSPTAEASGSIAPETS